jgi:hypothetical protein
MGFLRIGKLSVANEYTADKLKEGNGFDGWNGTRV